MRLEPQSLSVHHARRMPTGRLSTHVLDLTKGRPAAGVTIKLFAVVVDGDGGRRRLVKTVVTNADGRTDVPLLNGEEMAVGTFELVFHIGDYFGAATAERFLDWVPVRFAIHEVGGQYHVPLLVTPWAYQTYRGS